jgi:uncharacterized protein involved in exopolysaccharide biosynthesis
MAGFTLAEKEAQLDETTAAISAILSGAQSYRLGDRTVTRADLAQLEARQMRLEKDVDRLSGARPRVSNATFGGN